MQNNLAKARVLSRALEGSGYFTCLSQVHIPKTPVGGAVQTISNAAGQLEGMIKGAKEINEEDAEYYMEGLPVVSFRFSDEFKAQNPNLKQSWIQLQLRGIGWIVPKCVTVLLPLLVEKLLASLKILVRNCKLTSATLFLPTARTLKSCESSSGNRFRAISSESSSAISSRCKLAFSDECTEY